MRVSLEIGSGFYQSRVLPFNNQRCINLFPIVTETKKSFNMTALFGCPGTKDRPTTGAAILGNNRGARTLSNILYYTNGNNVYEISSGNVVTDRGALTGTGRVSQADNGRYLVTVVSTGEGWVFDNTNNQLTQITDTNYRLSSTVVFKDGFFVFSAKDGSVFFNSALNDPFTFDALDFGTAEINPDKIVALHVNHNELFVCGEKTIEIFQNIGGADFPFQRILGANIQKGVHARFSIREFDNTFVFAGGGDNELTSIWKVVGSSAVTKISTDAIDNAIQEFTEEEIANSFAYDYSQEGHFFVAFTFESTSIPSKTFVYDATASSQSGIHVWHEQQSGVTDNRRRINSVVKAYGKLIVGDQIDGRVGELDLNTFEEYGEPFVWDWRSSPFQQQGISIFNSEVELFMESGVGLTTGQGSNPIVNYSKSDNGGRTFSDATTRNYGKIGRYRQRTIWRKQGRIPVSRTIRFFGSDPVKRNLLKLEANSELGTM